MIPKKSMKSVIVVQKVFRHVAIDLLADIDKIRSSSYE